MLPVGTCAENRDRPRLTSKFQNHAAINLANFSTRAIPSMYSVYQGSKDEEQPAMERQQSATSMFEDEIVASNDPNQVSFF
jgi:hypothetical protein